jgi:aminoglycoside phosphotransferase (APT) family kinase protein
MKKPGEKQKYEKLVQRIAPGSRLLRTWPLTGGISAEMTVLELEDPEGRISRRIVRQPSSTVLQNNPDAALNEYKLLKALRRSGLATPMPVEFDQTGPTPYLVLEFIEGKSDFAPQDRPNFAYQLSTQLLKIHNIHRSNHDLAFLPEKSKAVMNRIGIRPYQMDHAFEEGRIREVLETAWPFPHRNADVLLHGDYWPGNVLWRADQLIAVIDWEDACWGDPLYDLAIARLDLLWIFGLEAMTSFTDYYQSGMPIDYTDLPYWDLYAALRFIRLAGSHLDEWAAYFHPYGRRDITASTIRTYYDFFIHQAFERLPTTY